MMKRCFVTNQKRRWKATKNFKSTISKSKKSIKEIKHGKHSLKQCILSNRSNVTLLHKIFLKKDQLNQLSEVIKTAEAGTLDFDMLNRDDLAVDFMKKYESGEILSLFEYKQQL